MSIITERFAPSPVESVNIEMEPGETSLGLYEAKRVVEQYISKGIPVNITFEDYTLSVSHGAYHLFNDGHKLAAISLLRSLSCQAVLQSGFYQREVARLNALL